MSGREGRERLATALEEARRVEKQMLAHDRAKDDAQVDALTERLGRVLQRTESSVEDADPAPA